MTARDVFISHATEDEAAARSLRTALQAAGISSWMAPDDVVVGKVPWAEQIVGAIADCAVTVVLLSGASTASTHVAREVSLALGADRGVLPIRLEPVTPTGALAYQLALYQRLDAFPGPIEDHLPRVLRMLETLLGPADGAAGETSTRRAPGPSRKSAPKPARKPAPTPADDPAPTPDALPGPDPRRKTETVEVPAVAALGTGGRVVAWTRANLPVSAGIAAAVLLLALGGVNALRGPGATPTASAPIVTAAPPTPTPRPPTAPPATPKPQTFDEQLDARIPLALTACKPSEVPNPDPNDLTSTWAARRECSDADASYVRYSLYTNLAEMKAALAAWRDYFQVPAGAQGECASGQVADTGWDQPQGTTQGLLLCAIRPQQGDGYVAWTDTLADGSYVMVEVGAPTLAKAYAGFTGGRYLARVPQP